jgi:hypothetical protein
MDHDDITDAYFSPPANRGEPLTWKVSRHHRGTLNADSPKKDL